MNRRNTILTLAQVVVGAGLLASGPLFAAHKNSKALRVGQSLRYDKGLRVTFLEVSADSRCPINAQCVSAGDATVLLRVETENRKAQVVEIHTDEEPTQVVIPAREYPPGMAGIPKSYVIDIESLDPLPFAGRPTRQSEYRLTLAISVAQ